MPRILETLILPWTFFGSWEFKEWQDGVACNGTIFILNPQSTSKLSVGPRRGTQNIYLMLNCFFGLSVYRRGKHGVTDSDSTAHPVNMRDKDPAVPDFGKRDAKYNSRDTSEVNVCHFCVWQGLPDRLNKSDLGDIESEGCGPLFPYLMTSSRLADCLRVHVPLSYQISRDSIDIPLSYLLK